MVVLSVAPAARAAWSTRQVAELAGTTVRAVRHYHQVGLLDEPERRANGYKSYGVRHLVRLVRIKRLADLGFSLPQIAGLGDSTEHCAEALHMLDAELAATVERLQRTRREVAAILRRGSPPDLPSDLAPASADAELSDADRAYIVVLTRVLGPTGLDAYRRMLSDYHSDPAVAEFDILPADADESTRDRLAGHLALRVRRLRHDYPGLSDLSDAPRGPSFAERTLKAVTNDLYNTAQLDVMQRATHLFNTSSCATNHDLYSGAACRA